MAEGRKIPTNWNSVIPGDIVSFRYKPKSGEAAKIETILVLNPKINVTLKDGTRTRHLIGIKMEETNQIELRVTEKQVSILERVGTFKAVDEKNGIYRMEIKPRFIINKIKGVKKNVYKLISRSDMIKGKYRTYDYLRAKKSAVYLEPIRIFTELTDED